MQVTFEPLVYPERWCVSLEQELTALVDDVIFKPLNDIVEVDGLFEERPNYDVSKYGLVESPLIAALNEGTIWYVGDTFYGNLNSKLSKDLRSLGAKFDTKTNTFVLSIDKMPYSLRSALIGSKAKAKEIHDKSIALLTVIIGFIKESKTMGLNIYPFLQSISDKAKNAFDNSIPETEEENNQIPQSVLNQIHAEAFESLDEAIREFSIQTAKDLQKCIVDNQKKYNGRTDKLKDCIRLYRGILKRHSNLLSSQQASILIAKYIKERAKAFGSTGYIWNTKLDARVRHSHERLEGQVFNWDDPPIVDLNTGRRANPGEDYNCRCSAKILLNTLKEEGVLA